MRDIAFLIDTSQSSIALTLLMAFDAANLLSDDPRYCFHFVSEAGGRVKTTSGLIVDCEPFTHKPCDTLVVCGGSIAMPPTPRLLSFMREAPKRHRRIAAIYTGAFVLAEAGLLNERRATTHWRHTEAFETRFPRVKLEHNRIFSKDGPLWSSAGGAAGLDLCLALIEEDLGAKFAKDVARALVLYNRRSGGQPQHSALLDLTPKSDRIHMALAYARENLHNPLTVAELARAACLSPRQFSRVFQAETGQSPAKAIATLRVEGARVLMEESHHPIEVIARQAGFSDRENMRRAFLRAFGQTPQMFRRNARLAEAEADSWTAAPKSAAAMARPEWPVHCSGALEIA